MHAIVNLPPPPKGLDAHNNRAEITVLPPNLAALLSQWHALDVHRLPAGSYSASHEHAWAHALGRPRLDGCLPDLRATQGAALPALKNGEAWRRLTPVHCRVAMDHVELVDPQFAPLAEHERAALWATLAPWIQEAGYQTHCDDDGIWWMGHPALATLRTASLARVVGQAVESWPPIGDHAAAWRQIQNEVQMLLHTHPVNEARAERGALEINSVWLSGTGPWPKPGGMTDVVVHHASAADDAWATLDAEVFAPLLKASAASGEAGPLRLTLCAPHAYGTWAPHGKAPWWRAWWPTRRASALAQWASLHETPTHG